MATRPKSSPLIQLLAALEAEGIRFIVAGMSAANLQGIMATTIDVDLWLDLPSRQYMRVTNLCRKLKATIQSPNKIFLSDDTPVDFIYEISGLKSFESEFRRAKKLPFHGLKVPVLSLPQIRRSKQAAARDKDKWHVLLIEQFLRLEKSAKRKAKRR